DACAGARLSYALAQEVVVGRAAHQNLGERRVRSASSRACSYNTVAVVDVLGEVALPAVVRRREIRGAEGCRRRSDGSSKYSPYEDHTDECANELHVSPPSSAEL